MSSKTYRIYAVHHTSGSPHEQLVGRFMIKDNEFHILEDNDHLLQDSFPEGFMSDQHQKLLWQLEHSGYYKVVPDQEANEGFHEDLIQDLDIGQQDPDAEYIIHEEGKEPQRLEMYGSSAILDGHKLGNEELNNLMNLVHTGKVQKVPL